MEYQISVVKFKLESVNLVVFEEEIMRDVLTLGGMIHVIVRLLVTQP